jgi:pSer/pThr/pTyr-binding forkhead associated (FHA) protein
MPQLRVLLGFQQGQVYSLDSRPMIIGREPGSDIVLDPESPASRRHAEILCESGEWTIRDLDSRNGTLINGSPVKCGALNHSDEILVGDSVFVFEYNDRLTAETEAAASRALPREPLGLQARTSPPRRIAVGDDSRYPHRHPCWWPLSALWPFGTSQDGRPERHW